MGNGCMKTKVVEKKSPTLPAFKVVVVGDSGSGKSSIIRRFVENRFEAEYTRTTDVNITSVVKKLNVPEHAIVTVELWDVPGQDDVDLRKTYYLDVDAVIVVVDISEEDSLSVAGSWSLDVETQARVSKTFTESIPNPDGKTFTQKIRKEYMKPRSGSIPILLLGNKYDLAKAEFIKELEDSEKTTALSSNGEVGNSPNINNDSKSLTVVPADAGKVNQNPDDKNTTQSRSEDSGSTPGVVKSPNDGTKSTKEVENPKGNDEDHKDSKKSEEDHDKKEDSGGPTPLQSNGNVVNVENNIGNGDLLHHQDSGNSPKKIHPKDEKNKLQRNGTINSPKKICPPEDVRSNVTITTSLVSILPPCVEEIERIAEKFGFIAGVPVSAKTANGGVQEAIQSVLRRLVAKKLFNLDAKDAVAERKNKNSDLLSTKSMKSSVSKSSGASKKKNLGCSEPLQEVGIIEIDEVIRRCNSPLQEAEEITAGYAEALQGFKMACYKHGFIGSTRMSLEACISALKEAVVKNIDPNVPTDPRQNIKLMLMTPEKQAEKENPGLNLVSHDCDGFPDLRIVNTQQEDVEKLNDLKPHGKIQVQPKILKVLSEYRENFLAKSISVLKHGEEVEALLANHTKELTAQEEKAWETAVAAGLSSADVRRILSTIAQDKARLRGTKDLVQETKRSVRSSVGKIKAALLF